MNIKNDIKTALMYIGTIVGAGFASGREIALYFGKQNVLAPLIGGVLIGLFSFVFLKIGSKQPIKISTFWQIIIKLTNFIIFSALIGACEDFVYLSLGLNGGGIFVTLISLLVIIKGNNSVKTICSIVTPLIIIFLLALCVLYNKYDAFGNFWLISPLLYASMNILTGGVISLKNSTGMNSKDVIFTSLIIFFIITLLILSVYFVARQNESLDMPIIAVSTKLNLNFYVGIVFIIAIFTSIVSTLLVISDGKSTTSVVTVCLGFCFSVLGFRKIVDYIYPIIGIIGIIFMVKIIFDYFKVSRGKICKTQTTI